MKKIEITKEQLQNIIKEGVENLHRKTIIENRIHQINKELNFLSNPEVWEEVKREAQAQLRKKNIAWDNLIPKEKLVSENNLSEKKYSDSASNFIGKEISHLMKDKGYEHERAVAAAINIAKDKGYKIPKKTNEDEIPTEKKIKEDVSNIMNRAAKLMAEAKEKYNKLAKKTN